MFKLRFLNWRTKKALRKNKALRTSTPYQAARQIGILFTVEDRAKHDDVKHLVKKFEAEGKQVTVLEFLPRKKENYEFMFDYFTFQDLDFWGNFDSAPLLRFMDTQFDYLIHLDSVQSPYMLNVLAKCKAHCRVGRFQEETSSYFELMISSGGNFRLFVDTLHSYLTRIK
ncbi:MAG: hypothetical protein K1X47_06130 [Cyclobacteriaceae bacterium]|nr:hypothetical protein [Cyclobacteriaceae bacterium]